MTVAWPLAWLLFGFGLSAATWAADSSGVIHIKAGRAALEANNPVAARAEFRAALGAALADEDRVAALLGLGRAELWLGDYRAALRTLEQARPLAASTDDRRAIATGAARALNALDDHRQAYALVAPFAPGDSAAMVELLRAQIALGRADQTLRFRSMGPAPDPSTRTGIDLLRAASQVDFELSVRGQGGYTYLHDSDGMTVMSYGLTALLPATPGGATFSTWRLQASTSDITAPGRRDRLTEADAGNRLRIGDSQHLDLQAGAGRTRGRTFLEVAAQWEDQPSDAVFVFASADRLPIVTPTALASGLLYSTLSLGASLRAADHWTFVPVYFHQVFSDDNRRDGGRLKVIFSPFEIPDSTYAVGAQVEARAYRSTEPSAGTYFNPARYRQEQVSLIGVHQLNPDWRMRLTAGIGSESVNSSSGRTWSGALSLIGRLPGNGRLELQAGRDSFASLAGGGSGYWSNGGSLIVSWPLF